MRDKASPTTLARTKPPKPIPLRALCVFISHATNNFLELPHDVNVVSDTFPNSNIPEVHVTLPESDKKNSSLRMNHPYALCDNYGHYSHHCPHLKDFCDTLEVIYELEFDCSKLTSSLPAYSSPTPTPKQEVSQTPIVIPPIDFKMMDNTSTILYLLPSMRSRHWNSLDISYCYYV